MNLRFKDLRFKNLRFKDLFGYLDILTFKDEKEI